MPARIRMPGTAHIQSLTVPASRITPRDRAGQDRPAPPMRGSAVAPPLWT